MNHGLWLYYLCVNLLAFVCFGMDKRKAVKQYWRIPEKVLLGLAFLGGGAGALAGMRVFRHKTRKWYFILVNILGLAANASMIFLVMQRF